MKNFDWEEFADSDNKITVHCDTEEKANDFLEEAHEHGIKWYEGEYLLKENYYNRHKENTCYASTLAYYKVLTYGEISYYKKNHYKIIEWETSDMEEFTEKDLKVGMLVKNKYYDTIGYGMIMPSKRNGIAIVYKNETWGDINFSNITEVWGYCDYVSEVLKFDFINRELLYKREAKKMTVKEICELVGFDVEIVKE